MSAIAPASDVGVAFDYAFIIAVVGRIQNYRIIPSKRLPYGGDSLIRRHLADSRQRDSCVLYCSPGKKVTHDQTRGAFW
jgi:hypothetical protein